MSSSFPDHFSPLAAGYRRHRPGYPEALFDWLAERAPARERAWDCAAGSGQAAVGLARRFARVAATDASAAQVVRGERAPRLVYAVATAEEPPFAARSFDLVCVAQALHWLRRERFYRAARRALRPGGLLAVWCYGLFSLGGDLDREIERYYAGELGPYWPAERRLIDERYATLDFPFAELETPRFEISLRWSREQLLGYLETWSALARARAAGADPLPALARRLDAGWGPDPLREVVWPIHLRAGRVE